MKTFRMATVFACLFSLLLGSCGGGGFSSIASAVSGGEGSGGGIGGTGVTSSGPVSGFGSVFVNGVEFETDDAEITVNGNRVDEAALGLGMLVVVRGTVNEDGISGVAESIAFESALRGPVASIAHRPEGDLQLLDVLGVEVLVTRGVTVFEAVAFETLAENDLLDISGYVSGNGRLEATRIVRTGSFVPQQSDIDRTGVVANLGATEFQLDDFVVDFSAADVSGLPDTRVQEGARVVVRGTLSNGRITAREIVPPGNLSADLERDAALVIQGAVTHFAGLGDFRVGRVAVDAGNAEFQLSGETLDNGLIVQVSGTWNGTKLIAQRVISRQGRILASGTVAAVSAREANISLRLFNAELDFVTNTETLVVDNTGAQDRLTLAGISTGDYVIVEALSRSDTRLALRVSRSAERSTVLNAVVEAFEPGVSIRVQGLTVNTAGAAFIGRDGAVLSTDAFYSQLNEGDVVRLIDEVTADGRVDSVRLVATDAAPQLTSR